MQVLRDGWKWKFPFDWQPFKEYALNHDDSAGA